VEGSKLAGEKVLSPIKRSTEPLKSVSNINIEFETAPSSLNLKDRKTSAPTLLFVKKPIPSYPTVTF